MESARRHGKPVRRLPKQRSGRGIQLALPFDLASLEQCVALALPRKLPRPRFLHASSHRRTGFAGRGATRFRIAQRRHLDVQVDPIK